MRPFAFPAPRTTPKRPPRRWFATHGRRCIAEGVDLLGTRDSALVSTYDLFQAQPRVGLLAAVIAALSRRGIGAEPDRRFCGPSFVHLEAPRKESAAEEEHRILLRRSKVLLFRLGEGETDEPRPSDSLVASRFFAHVVIALVPAKETVATMAAIVATTVELSASDTRRLQMYIKWLTVHRPPLNLEHRMYRWMGDERRARLLALLARFLTASTSLSLDERWAIETTIRALHPRQAARPERPGTKKRPPSKPSLRSPAVEAPRAPPPPPPRIVEEPPAFDRKKLRIHSSHRGRAP